MMKKILSLYFSSWWLPACLYVCLLVVITVLGMSEWKPPAIVGMTLLCGLALGFVGVLAAALWNFRMKRWLTGSINALLVIGCGTITFSALAILLFASAFGASEDGFADNLTIPQGIEIAEPQPDAADEWSAAASDQKYQKVSEQEDPSDTDSADEYQKMILNALASPGSSQTEFTPDMPSLRKASTDHAQAFRDYIEASPDWHVFIEQGNRFAARRWTYNAEPRDSLHGYVSEFFNDNPFQTRCLLCLDRKQWSRYSVQHAQEGKTPVNPKMTRGNNLEESRVMLECGGTWVEIFEQSNQPERRVTKATIVALENEFAEFLKNPDEAIAKARARSRELAARLAGSDGQPFRLLIGMQPGIYGVAYSLNPGEPGLVYLRAFEVTKGTPLSVERLAGSSRTRMTWSNNPAERFGAKAGFTIYEGDWGKPYAARFEVWFKPDSGKGERKLAERIFKIEGWQR